MSKERELIHKALVLFEEKKYTKIINEIKMFIA